MKRMKKLLLMSLMVLNIVCVGDELHAMRKTKDTGGETKGAAPEDDNIVEEEKNVVLTISARKEFPMHNQLGKISIVVYNYESDYLQTIDPITRKTYYKLVQEVEKELDANLKTPISDEDDEDVLENLDKAALKKIYDARWLWIYTCVDYAHAQINSFLAGQYSKVDYLLEETRGTVFPQTRWATTPDQQNEIDVLRKKFERLNATEVGADHRAYFEKIKKRDHAKFLADCKRFAPAREAAQRARQEKARQRREEEKRAAAKIKEEEDYFAGRAAADKEYHEDCRRDREERDAADARCVRRKDRCKEITGAIVGGSIEAILYGMMAYSIHDAIQTAPVMPGGVVNKAPDICVVS